jgi:hypothetical protein
MPINSRFNNDDTQPENPPTPPPRERDNSVPTSPTTPKTPPYQEINLA